MSLEITKDALSKLTHEAKEIRLRALEQIETKFVRATAHQLDIAVNAVDLCKKLIYWFNLKPIETPARVLLLLKNIFNTKYGDEAMKAMGTTRLNYELQKLQKILKNKAELLRIVDDIMETIDDKEKQAKVARKDDDDDSDDCEIVEMVQKMSLGNNSSSNDDCCYAEAQMYGPHDCEAVWSRPTTADYNSLKFVADVLAGRQQHSLHEVNTALLHLQLTLADYPAEYMLQSPHIFVNLLQFFDMHDLDAQTLGNVIETLKCFLCILKQRLIERRKVANFCAPQPPPPTQQRGLLHFSLHNLKPKSQLKIEKAMELLMEKLLQQLTLHAISIRSEILHVIKAMAMVLDILNLQQLTVNSKIFQMAQQIGLQLQSIYTQDDAGGHHINLTRSRELWLNFTLHDMAMLNAKRSQLLGGQLSLLETSLFDFSFRRNFPKRFEQLKALIFQAKPQMILKFEKLQNWQANVEAAILVLRAANLHEKRTSSAALLLNNAASNFINTLDTLNSLQLVRQILQAIIECTPNYLSNAALKKQASGLLAHLLQLKQLTLRDYVYRNVAKALKKHFVALMNGETYCVGIPNANLLKALIIGVPWNSQLFELIINESSGGMRENENENEQQLSIKANARDILLLIIRARRFFESAQETFLDFLTPMLPLIQSLLSLNAHLSDATLKLLDPDTARLPFLYLFRCNIGLLFQPADDLRNEALTRLIYMLNLLPESSAYLPNVMEISDVLPNDLCILPSPRQFRQIFAATETYYETSTLYNLLTLLDTADIEPGVRKSALMQLNVMLKNWQLTGAFCELDAHCLVLRVLEHSLQKASSIDYIESVIPAVCIIAKLLIYDSNFRQELCVIPNVYVLLMRALFHFAQDPQMRQYVSICLFLLHFGSYVVVPPAGGHFIGPRVFQNLKCPLALELKSQTFLSVNGCSSSSAAAAASMVQSADIQSQFPNEQQWTAYMRQLIAHAYFDGSATLTKNHVAQLQNSLDVCPKFLLQLHDMRFANATDPMCCLRKLLRLVSNATDDKTLVKASNSLQFYLILMGMDGRGKFELSTETTNAMFSYLSKYLQVTPGNDTDFTVYECVLDLFQYCLHLQLDEFAQQMLNALRSDFNHAMIVMLRNAELPLDFLNRLSIFLADLFALAAKRDATATLAPPTENKRIRDCAFRSNFFELLHKLMLEYYASEQLQLVRCMQRIICQLAPQTLALPQQKIFECRKAILRLSIGIRTTTQTGAQWHRNILRIYAQLHEKLTPAQVDAQACGNALKHLVGLAGHNDKMVRALAWLCLCQIAGVAHYRPPHFEASKAVVSTTVAAVAKAEKLTRVSGASMLAERIQHLPGGLVGCCLSTMLDHAEIAIVRNYAGLIFVQLLHETCNFEKATTLLEQHGFFNEAYSTLENCIFEETFQLHSPFLQAATTPYTNGGSVGDHEESGAAAAAKFATCELVILYCRICLTLVQKRANYIEELCEKVLLFKLYELLKQPAANNPIHYNMCAHICQLYTACAVRNLVFLQRTLCHDERWLLCYFPLMRPPTHAPDACVAWVLQLLLALAREDFVYQRLCSFALENVEVMLKLFQRALHVQRLNQTLQCNALSLLTYLLLRSQLPAMNENDFSFLKVLEQNVAKMVHDRKPQVGTKFNADSDEDKENKNANIQRQKKTATKPTQQQKTPTNAELTELTLAELLLADLSRLFSHIYPVSNSKFEVNPTPTKIQICETIAILLKSSQHACKAASNLRFFDKILHVFNTFLHEEHTNCTVYVRRYGETKKLAVLQNLQVLIQILLHWFSPAAAVLDDESQCYELTKILIKIWPWLTHSGDLREQVIKLLAFLSERSLLICRQFSSLISGCSHTILQLVIKIAVTETQKVRTSSTATATTPAAAAAAALTTSPSAHETIIQLALRVMINCCACSEGRFTLVKEHVLNIFDNLYPLNLKAHRTKIDIVLNWLQFWELFSRYSEGAQARNLNALCDVIDRTRPCSPIRLLCLKILRNMCFQTCNRNTLISSNNFMRTIDAIISLPISHDWHTTLAAGGGGGGGGGSGDHQIVSYEEQYIVSVCLWRIVSGGVKYVARIRGTRLLTKIRILREKLQNSITNSKEEIVASTQAALYATDLFSVLNIIFQIFEE